MADALERTTRRVSSREPRDRSIHIRAPRQARELIEKAAEMSGKTLTDFVLDSATQRATDVLLDQRLFMLDRDGFEAFMRALDDPPAPGPKLKALMSRRPMWDR